MECECGDELLERDREIEMLSDQAESWRARAERAEAAIERATTLAMQHRSVEQHNEMVPLSDIADLIREPTSADYLAALDTGKEKNNE